MLSIEFLTWMTTFALIILNELGDKTQVAVLLLASNNPNKRWWIFAAGAAALTACVLLEVTAGALLARYIGPAVINRVTGVVFLLLGSAILIKQINLSGKIRSENMTAGSQDIVP